jgi:hypothetical protein
MDEGVWELSVDTGSSTSPLGPRFFFGAGCPNFIWQFTSKKDASEASTEWEEYFKKVAKRRK